jgi:hypothetical protein
LWITNISDKAYSPTGGLFLVVYRCEINNFGNRQNEISLSRTHIININFLSLFGSLFVDKFTLFIALFFGSLFVDKDEPFLFGKLSNKSGYLLVNNNGYLFVDKVVNLSPLL